MKIPAYLVLRIISLILIIIGLSLFIFPIMCFVYSGHAIQQYCFVTRVLGFFLVMIAIVGPIKVIYNGAQLPSEIKHMITVQAITMSISGVSLIVASLINIPIYEMCLFVVVGIMAILSAIAGLYPLSKKLPNTFYIDEMISIIKSAGISGDKKNSKADQAFLRWTQGRDGIQVGSNAIDGTVITMDNQKVLLSSFFGDNPLVLNFGSYSCPHYRKCISEIETIMKNWQDRDVDFLTIYTAEAHTDDGWKLVNQYVSDEEYTNENDFCFSYAKNIDERKNMAQWLIDKKHFNMPIVLDSMSDELLKEYNSWPIRLYVVYKSKIVYCGDQGPFGYNPDDLDIALKKLLLTIK